ncbi:TPA: hypothetical protein EYP66_11475 [Candidatus Poribacteria bacterium]|nr:hypothetical protein [Candidatus Poribacteria bacterium]
MTEYRHIIWDWNGTLFDDAWLCVEIVNGLLRNRNKPCISHKQYQEAFDFPIESFESVATEFIVEYDKRRFECKLQDNAITVLEACAATGFAVKRSRPFCYETIILTYFMPFKLSKFQLIC